jgi:tRNA (guanosine-2'-O-)-methyltransferase
VEWRARPDNPIAERLLELAAAVVRLVASIMLLAACRPASAAPTSHRETVLATNLVAPPETSLEQVCMPTGPELCFNAIDDNCNGVIDEGCGLQTGVLQFMIAWAASAVDVNLVVTTPKNERVPDERTRSTPSGFHLDRDCPGDEGCLGQNVENVYLDGFDPPRGRYVVEIVLVNLHGIDPPVRVRFGARLGARSVGFDVDLAPGEDARKTFTFDLP